MASYTAKHLYSGETFSRPKTFQNPYHVKSFAEQKPTDPAIETLHRSLPDYGETTLHSLPSVAEELGFSHVLVKDEGTRFGLPSFKVTGASWALYRVLRQHLKIYDDQPLSVVRDHLRSRENLTIVTCTEGNWGRAVARMTKYLRIQAKIFVPGFMNDYTRNLIRGEGAELIVCENGSYDDSVAAAIKCSNETDALLVMDTSFDDYEQIPRWVTEGYSTIMHETDRQTAKLTGGREVDIATCSVGAGSWAQAVVGHYKVNAHPATVVSVEADTASAFKESLHVGSDTTVETTDTIMCGMNCGTISKIAWPVLKAGVGTAVVVEDREAHQCVLELRDLGINAGPCGAANLAALRALCREGEGLFDKNAREGKIVVLYSTEGAREYEVPE